MKSWKTTVLGILVGVGIIVTQLIALLDSDPLTIFSIELLFAGLGSIGLGWFARDDNVTSESAGAK